MNNLTEDPRAGRKKKIKRTGSAVLTALAVLLLLTGVVWLIYYFNIFPLPGAINRLFERVTSDTLPEKDEESRIADSLYSYIPSNYQQENFSVSVERAAEILDHMIYPDKFLWTVRVTVFSDNKSSAVTHTLYKQGDSYRIESVSGAENKLVIRNEKKTYLKNVRNSQSRLIEGDLDFNFSNQINIADAKELSLDSNNAVSEIYIGAHSGEPCLFVKYENETLDKTEELIISLKYGVVLDNTTAINGKTVYRLETISLTDTVDFQDHLFHIP